MKLKRILCLTIILVLGLLCACGDVLQPDAAEEQAYEPMKLTLEDIHSLAALGDALTLADIPGWAAMSQWGEMLKSSPSERRFAVYSVEGGYRLEVGAENKESEKPSFITLTPIWESNGIDIRGANIAKFLREHPSTEAVTAEEARAVLASYLGGSPRLEETLPEHFIDNEACYHFTGMSTKKQYAVGRRYGTAYEIETDKEGELLAFFPLEPATMEQRGKTLNIYLDKLPVAGDWGGYDWVVLAKEDGRWLCITKDIVEMRKFHETETTVSWAESGLRAYLNGEFLKTTFGTSGDRDRVLLSENKNDSVTFPNGNTGIGGEATQDYVFLLSYEEAEKYFPNDLVRAAKYDGQAQFWWLRSPGDYLNKFANVDAIGQVCYSGGNVHTGGLGVRPAVWRFHAPDDAS